MKLSRTDLELEVLVRRIEDGEIDLQPDYQRGEIWNTAKKVRLIDSILRGWYIPAVHMLREGGEVIENVLDGQQRLAAIRDFFRGEFRVAGDTEPVSEEIQALDGRTFQELPVAVQARVRRFPLTVVTVVEYLPQEPFELFFRLNQQAVLSPSEKRNALFGEARNQIREIVDHLREDRLLTKETVGFSNGRLGYDDVVARVALAFEMGTLNQQINNRAIENFYRHQSYSPAAIASTVEGAESFLTALRLSGVRQNKASLFSWIVAMGRMRPEREEWVPAAASLLRDHKSMDALAHEVGSSPPRSSKQGVLDEQNSLELWQFQYGVSFVADDRPKFEILELVKLFGNRASYRANDVKSVMLRDFALHALLVTANAGHSAYAKKVEAVLPTLARPTDEDRLYDSLQRVGWGSLD